MSPQGIEISTTYETRVALERPCNKPQGIAIGRQHNQRSHHEP
jgi:hypothetical protein